MRSDPVPSSSAASAPVVELRGPDTLRLGDGAVFDVHVRNPHDSALTLYLTGREPTAEIVIERDGRPVWSSLDAATVQQIVAVRTLPPGASFTIPVNFGGTMQAGVALRAGSYQVHASVLTDAAPLSSTPRALLIVER